MEQLLFVLLSLCLPQS